MTTPPPTLRRVLTASTAVFAMLLLVLGTILVQSVSGRGCGHAGDGTVAASSAALHVTPMTTAAAHDHAGAARADATAGSGDGGDGLCALVCALLGMACVIVVVLLASAVLRRRTGGLLHLLARRTATAALHARRVAEARPPSLTALQVIRI